MKTVGGLALVGGEVILVCHASDCTKLKAPALWEIEFGRRPPSRAKLVALLNEIPELVVRILLAHVFLLPISAEEQDNSFARVEG